MSSYGGRAGRGGQGENPLRSGDPAVWQELIEAVAPAAMLVVIRCRMSPALLEHLSEEDIWQETLLAAWREREQFEWRGIRSFKCWLIQVALNQIRGAADRIAADKRGGGHRTLSAPGLEGGSSAGGAPALDRLGPPHSTTPSRILAHREQAEAMRAGLAGLPEELRDVVRLRLFEERKLEEVATELGLGLSAVRHRLRRGVELYERIVAEALATRLPGDRARSR